MVAPLYVGIYMADFMVNRSFHVNGRSSSFFHCEVSFPLMTKGFITSFFDGMITPATNLWCVPHTPCRLKDKGILHGMG